ncbi:flagellar brake protein [Cohnella caldifontis]|uniref:flagellar brake protein n=1 Tax=Cohnella caldifontis TaxID=3027471 RepID=UPI0023EBEDCD|nr:PilZ domain-containing protein [Cohnella sp. YIM B05605]
MLPKINQTTFLQPLPDQDPETASTLRSRVADLDDKSIWLEIPLDEKTRRYHRPQVGEQFRLFYFTQEGVKHLFNTTVTGVKKDTVTIFSVRKPVPEDIQREQRRSFLRVEAQLELAVRMGDKVRFTAITDDVGGGGLSFRTDRKWPMVPGAALSCWLLLNYKNGNLAHAKFDGEVVRVMPVEPDKHLVMMRFQDIQDAEQQKIIRYCFERQLDKHKG